MKLIKISEKLNTQGKCMAYLEQHRWPTTTFSVLSPRQVY
jgi:hypothetical protein